MKTKMSNARPHPFELKPAQQGVLTHYAKQTHETHRTFHSPKEQNNNNKKKMKKGTTQKPACKVFSHSIDFSFGQGFIKLSLNRFFFLRPVCCCK